MTESLKEKWYLGGMEVLIGKAEEVYKKTPRHCEGLQEERPFPGHQYSPSPRSLQGHIHHLSCFGRLRPIQRASLLSLRSAQPSVALVAYACFLGQCLASVQSCQPVASLAGLDEEYGAAEA